jgi:hypothetical protein
MISLGAGNGWEAASDYDPDGIAETPNGWRPTPTLRHAASKCLPEIQQAAQELGLEAPTIWLGRIDPQRPHRVGCFLHGTSSEPALVLFCERFEHLADPRREILLTLLHELAHACLESFEADGHPQEEALTEMFARRWTENSAQRPNPAALWLRGKAKTLSSSRVAP